MAGALAGGVAGAALLVGAGMYVSSEKRRKEIRKRLSGQFAKKKDAAPAKDIAPMAANPLFRANEHANPLYVDA